MELDEFQEPEYDERCKHPTVEQLFIREATKCLTAKQRAVWEYHNYDRLTQEEIAEKLNKARTTIETQIGQCERAIAKWCKEHKDVYEMLKSQSSPKEVPDRANGVREARDAKHQTPRRETK